MKYGVSPDTVLYLYTHSCCDSWMTPIVNNVASHGYKFRKIEIVYPSATDLSVIHCFRSQMPQWVPEFICSADGDSIIITDPNGANTKITNFAKDCKAAAGSFISS
jgi:hypothetical protein